ncbi:hypothetical protein G8A07_06945 [Roseateles sp. DAIF2]|uniref:hypothetical protein n=1 Tax=Roseateles sp. DAIF2 TaxID=2714952 RepID=UPI0018A24DDE|nr:hypothetical protein [Roseateles sp. DAIF2]QPF72690.1 hypothetical protein G8A07_06945 [Roseateles sp. DAIF2]
MSAAYADFAATLQGLREEAAELPPTVSVAVTARSAAHLRLNGLTVAAFSALEDFIKRRAHEVACWLGKKGVTFDWLPPSLQSEILIGTLKGLHHSLERADKSDRDVMIQLEALVLAQAGENTPFSPSKYFFGHSTSNLSESIIKTLIKAFGYSDADAAMDEVARQLSYPHLGRVMEQFTILAKNRHTAAHAFPADYRRADFEADVKIKLPVLAACFDTCISQVALLILKNFNAGVGHTFSQTGFLEKTAQIRVAEWDSAKKGWNELLHGKTVKQSSKSEFQRRLVQFRLQTLAIGHTVVVKDERGLIRDWIQPLI